MKTLFLVSLLSLPLLAQAAEQTIYDAKVSCIRVVGQGEDFFDVEPELFFWNESQAQEAKNLFDQGYSLKRYIHSNVLCGGYTPNIEVSSTDRDDVKNAIQSYDPVLEDGDVTWETNIVFKK